MDFKTLHIIYKYSIFFVYTNMCTVTTVVLNTNILHHKETRVSIIDLVLFTSAQKYGCLMHHHHPPSLHPECTISRQITG